MNEEVPNGGSWWRRRWVQLVGAGFLGLILGGGLGGGDTSGAEQSGRAQQLVAEAERRAASAEQQAAAAKETARREVEKELAGQREQLKAQAAQVEERERKVTGQEAEAAASTVPGDGLFLVGSDIEPGVYKADPSPSDNCYFARLSSTDTGDIIDNGNTSGPVVITVRRSDKALQLNGCAAFRKVG